MSTMTMTMTMKTRTIKSTSLTVIADGKGTRLFYTARSLAAGGFLTSADHQASRHRCCADAVSRGVYDCPLSASDCQLKTAAFLTASGREPPVHHNNHSWHSGCRIAQPGYDRSCYKPADYRTPSLTGDSRSTPFCCTAQFNAAFSEADISSDRDNRRNRPRSIVHHARGDGQFHAHCGSSASQWPGHQIGAHLVKGDGR